MERLFYILKLQLYNQTKYLIWYSDELDGLLKDSASLKILAFKNQNDLLGFAERNSLFIQKEEPVLHNLDYVREWLKGDVTDIDCNALLIAWNLFTDVVTSLKIDFIGNKKDSIRNRIYDKLFFGTNIFAVTPEGEEYTPHWTKVELAKLADIMNEGIAITSENLQEV